MTNRRKDDRMIVPDVYLPGDWIHQAVCTPDTAESWHPDKEDTSQSYAARQVCLGCPVAEECLAYALQDPLLTGIWGGTSSAERGAIRDGKHGGSRPRPTVEQINRLLGYGWGRERIGRYYGLSRRAIQRIEAETS